MMTTEKPSDVTALFAFSARLTQEESLQTFIAPWDNEGEARLEDKEGHTYSLVNNGDGTETALYDDDSSVTFRQDDKGSLVYLAGTVELLPVVADSYYAYLGLDVRGGKMDMETMIYRPGGRSHRWQESRISNILCR